MFPSITAFNINQSRYTLQSHNVVKIQQRDIHDPSKIKTTFIDLDDLAAAVAKLKEAR